jgi:hypothetical protein
MEAESRFLHPFSAPVFPRSIHDNHRPSSDLPTEVTSHSFLPHLDLDNAFLACAANNHLGIQ